MLYVVGVRPFEKSRLESRRLGNGGGGIVEIRDRRFSPSAAAYPYAGGDAFLNLRSRENAR